LTRASSSHYSASEITIIAGRLTETLAEPLVLTTDSDFGVYRRHGRKVIPFLSPD